MKLEVGWVVAGRIGDSSNTRAVARMFGLRRLGGDPVTIVPPMRFSLFPGQVVFVTGASGGGKSSLLRLIGEKLEESDTVRVRSLVFRAGQEGAAVVDQFGEAPLNDVLRWTSLAGLAEARVLLGDVSTLSAGQRHRLALARVMAQAERDDRWTVVLADEFATPLDRAAAWALAHRVRRWVSAAGKAGGGVTFIAATTHDDVLEPLDPDLLIDMRGGGAAEVFERPTHSETRP